jgi:hypothetical protein
MYPFILQHEFGIAVVLVVLVLASGCAARLTVHPGAFNRVDSAAYDSLLIAEAAIDQAKIAYAAGQLPGGRQGLDALIASYGVAREAWLTYRGALGTNVSPQAYLDKLNSNLADLVNAIRVFEEAK